MDREIINFASSFDKVLNFSREKGNWLTTSNADIVLIDSVLRGTKVIVCWIPQGRERESNQLYCVDRCVSE